jgi:hypothetical protein
MEDVQRTPGRKRALRNILHVWLAFVLFTASVIVLLRDIAYGPRVPDEIGVGRAMVSLAALAVWFVVLLVSLFLWRGLRKAADSSKALPIVLWILAIGFSGLVIENWREIHSDRSTTLNERNATRGLYDISMAEEVFRQNPASGGSFWMGDVSTLYTHVRMEGESPLKLIELSVALADAAPLAKGLLPGPKPIETFGVRMPRAGYWYRAIASYEDPSGKTLPYHTGNGLNPKHYGFCAYPASTSAGSKLFIIDEHHIIYWRKMEGEALDTNPGDLSRGGWKKLE